MGYHTTFTGQIRVDPPLSQRQRHWLVSLHIVEPSPDGHPPLGHVGWWSPWLATPDGMLHIPEEIDKPRQAPEWLAWIMRELRDPLFARDPAIAGDHTFAGTMTAQGGCEGDRYELRVQGERISVHRKGLPCWPCWRETQYMVPPSAAYAFGHPEATSDRDSWIRPTAEVLARDEPRCRAAAWRPSPRWRRVYWPPRFVDWWRENVSDPAAPA